jgi:hypothetical protein
MTAKRSFSTMSVAEIEDFFCHSACYPVAIILSRQLDWKIGALLIDWREWDWRPRTAHAYVIAPDGRVLDAKGLTTTTEISERYLSDREGEYANPRFIEYVDENEYRAELSSQYYNQAIEAGRRTAYDAFMDRAIPNFQRAVLERLSVVELALAEFPGYSPAS